MMIQYLRILFLTLAINLSEVNPFTNISKGKLFLTLAFLCQLATYNFAEVIINTSLQLILALIFPLI